MQRLVWMLLLAGCNVASIGNGKDLQLNGQSGPIAVPDGDGGVVIVPGDQRKDAGYEGPYDSGQVFDPFGFASVGTLCEDGQLRRYIVLSSKTAACPDGRALLETQTTSANAAYAEIPEGTGPGSHALEGTICLGSCTPGTLQLELDTLDEGEGAVGHYVIQLDGSRAEGDVDADWCSYDGAELVGPPLAPDLTITDVALYQAVKIPLMEGGAVVEERSAPVIVDKAALIRVFVERSPGFITRALLGRLTLGAETLDVPMSVNRDSEETERGSTFEFRVPPEMMTDGVEWAVSIHETEGCAPGGAGGARFPEEGLVPLEPESSGGPFELVIVPVQYNADGSGRLPDLTQSQFDLYYGRAYAMFPASDTNLTVRAQPLVWNSAIRSSGSGWGSLLDAVIALRSQDNVPDNVWYFGAFVPASSFGAYCGGGCVAGLGMVPGANDTYNRGSIGLGFTGQGSTETFTHEVGHSLGRPHAPCGVSGEANYPYQGARIGVWGYHLVEDEMMSPSNYRDMMSYCDPQWISDYNYERLFRRIRFGNANPLHEGPVEAPQVMWRAIIDDVDGVRWGHDRHLVGRPGGVPTSVTFVHEDGHTQRVEAYRQPFTHVNGGFLILPDPPRSVVRVRLLRGTSLARP